MISILLPSRNRPNSVRRLLESVSNTSVFPFEIVVYTDDDDISPRIDGIKYIVGPRIVLSQCYNECYKHASGEIIMFCSDDVVFRTKAWDKQVTKAFPDDDIAFVHGDDGYNGDKFGTHGFLSRKWVDTIGYVLPPYFSADYSDNWVNEVADSIGRRVYISAVFEHLHPSLGKAEIDQTFLETRLKGYEDNVAHKYKDLQSKRNEDIGKLRCLKLPL